MADGTYNGWTNYETWVVNVWDEDNNAYTTAKQILEDGSYDFSLDKDKRAYIQDVADALQSQLDNALDTLDLPGIFLDLLGNDCVNWREIAEHACDLVWEELAELATEEEDNEQD